MNNPLELTSDARHLREAPPNRVLIVGARRQSRRLVRSFKRGPWANHSLVGFIDAGHGANHGRRRQVAIHPRFELVPVLGGLDRIDEFVDRAKATDVVVAVSPKSAPRLRLRMARLVNSDVAVHWVIDDGTNVATPMGELAIEAVSSPISWSRLASRIAKRGLDIFGAAVGLTLLAPLFAYVSIAILVTSGRPIFYRQERVGQGGKTFRIVKFRSMARDAEGQTGPVWATSHDARCTWIGDWLRDTTIDELPQLYNVLKGEMSLVGPRPERPVFVEDFKKTVPDYELRHAVPGGMTGWAQVHGWRGRTSLRKRIQYDLDYIQRWSFWMDIRILFMTVLHVSQGKTEWTTRKSRTPS